MILKQLNLKDKKTIEQFLRLNNHELAVYSFANIYIWRGLFKISWAVYKSSLFVFFQDKCGMFLYLSPLAKELSLDALSKAFEAMDSVNKNKDISRIENAQGYELDFYRSQGYSVKEKSKDYICLREDLVNLKGEAFRHKRSSYNYFVKNFSYEYLPYCDDYANACLKLYNLWAAERKLSYQEDLYHWCLDDSKVALKVLLEEYKNLWVEGRVVKVGRGIKAFSFGYKLDNDTFCILYEIADLKFKGIAQFIFRQFCMELEDFKYINIMDDSGLENLKKVKLSYRPVKAEPAYIVKR
ncbi:MAG: DUF2156 domain-containing protein [Candidatus Omnitrophica bacterium]|nr:DUF2156 domain-containing protein [Candidatus Omnitrophota bacterium]